MQGERTFLDKYIRAGSLVFLLVLFAFSMLADGNLKDFSVKTEYVTGLISLLTVVLPSYYAAKTIDKWKAKDVNNIS